MNERSIDVFNNVPQRAEGEHRLEDCSDGFTHAVFDRNHSRRHEKRLYGMGNHRYGMGNSERNHHRHPHLHQHPEEYAPVVSKRLSNHRLSGRERR